MDTNFKNVRLISDVYGDIERSIERLETVIVLVRDCEEYSVFLDIGTSGETFSQIKKGAARNEPPQPLN